MSEPLDLEPIRRRLPSIPREQMSRHEEDRADLLAEVKRLRGELARRDEQMDLLLEDFDYAYDKMAHGAPAAMHDLASRLLGGGAS